MSSTNYQNISKLEDALASDDIESIEKAAHSTKGGAANLGAIRLSRLAGKIEKAAKDKDPAACKELARQVRDNLEKVLVELAKDNWRTG